MQMIISLQSVKSLNILSLNRPLKRKVKTHKNKQMFVFLVHRPFRSSRDF